MSSPFSSMNNDLAIEQGELFGPFDPGAERVSVTGDLDKPAAHDANPTAHPYLRDNQAPVAQAELASNLSQEQFRAHSAAANTVAFVVRRPLDSSFVETFGNQTNAGGSTAPAQTATLASGMRPNLIGQEATESASAQVFLSHMPDPSQDWSLGDALELRAASLPLTQARPPVALDTDLPISAPVENAGDYVGSQLDRSGETAAASDAVADILSAEEWTLPTSLDDAGANAGGELDEPGDQTATDERFAQPQQIEDMLQPAVVDEDLSTALPVSDVAALLDPFGQATPADDIIQAVVDPVIDAGVAALMAVADYGVENAFGGVWSMGDDTAAGGNSSSGDAWGAWAAGLMNVGEGGVEFGPAAMNGAAMEFSLNSLMSKVQEFASSVENWQNIADPLGIWGLGGATGFASFASAPPNPEVASSNLLQNLSVDLSDTVTINAVSNDSSYTDGSLWGMYGDKTATVNQYGSQAGEAWAAGFTGATKTVVGVVDTGIDYTHPDLYLNIWLNQGEIPNAFKPKIKDTDSDGLITFRDLNNLANKAYVTDKNNNGYIDAGDLLKDARWADGIDQDKNGYTDDLIGWDFFNNDNDPFDDHGHGTHVS